MLPKTSYEQHRFSDYFKTNLPHHWSEKRLGFLAAEEKAAFVDGPFGSDLKATDYVDEGVPLIQLNNIRDSKHLMQNMKFVSEEKKQELFRHIAIPGDIVIAKMAEPVARAAIVNEAYQEYVIVADCVKFTPNLNLINLRYLVWAINCDYVRINAELVSTGTTRVRINLGELKKLKIPYPTELEQKAIANFLDHETAKIDTLIEQQQQLIQLLKEKRQAVISHAVTKGLSSLNGGPNAPMKDSGVEWLGEVPAHWEVSQLKYKVKNGTSITYGIVQAGPHVDDGIPYIKTSDMSGDKLPIDGYSKTSHAIDNSYSRSKVYEGDIVIAIRASVGKCLIVPKEISGANLTQGTAKISPSGEICSDYLLAYLSSAPVQLHLNTIAKGATFKEITLDMLRRVPVLVPPIEEQKKIMLKVQTLMERFTSLISNAELQMYLLSERRTALISAAVTGKIDVRHFVSKDGQAPQQ